MSGLSSLGGAEVLDPTLCCSLSPHSILVIHQVWLPFHHPTLQEVSWPAPHELCAIITSWDELAGLPEQPYNNRAVQCVQLS